MKIDINTFYYVSNHCAKSHGRIHSSHPWCALVEIHQVHNKRPSKTMNFSVRFCTVLRHIIKGVDINFHAKMISIFFFMIFFLFLAKKLYKKKY